MNTITNTPATHSDPEKSPAPALEGSAGRLFPDGGKEAAVPGFKAAQVAGGLQKRETVFVALPVVEKMQPEMVMSFLAAVATTQKAQLQFHLMRNDSLIARVRSVQLSCFYWGTQCDWYFHISDDLEIKSCEVDDNIFDRLLAHDKDFCGCIYAANALPSHAVGCPLDPQKPLRPGEGLREMKWLSGGVWLLKRQAVKKMIEAYPELAGIGDIGNWRGQPVHYLFLEEIIDEPEKGIFRKFLSEDYAFCNRWRKIGGQIWADTDLVLRHWGEVPFSLELLRDREGVAPAEKNKRN